jgi:hypothetical protein
MRLERGTSADFTARHINPKKYKQSRLEMSADLLAGRQKKFTEFRNNSNWRFQSITYLRF